MRAILATALCGAALPWAAPAALACSCARGPNVPLPPVVLKARVLAVGETTGGRTARLQVLGVERGRAAARRITVHTPAHGAACGVAFTRGSVGRFGMSAAVNGVHTANLCQQFAPGRRR